MSHLPAELIEAVYRAELEADCADFSGLVELLSQRITVGAVLALVARVYKSKRDGTLVGSRFAEIGREIEEFGSQLKVKYGV